RREGSPRIEKTASRVIRIELDPICELDLSPRKGIIVMGFYLSESGGRFPEVWIQYQRLNRCGFRLGEAFCGREASQVSGDDISISKSSISRREVGILFGRLLEKLDALPHAGPRSLIQIIAGLDKELISLRVGRDVLGQPGSLGAVQAQLQL